MNSDAAPLLSSSMTVAAPTVIAEAVDHVVTRQPEHVHRHLAGHEFDAERLGRFEQLGRACDVVLAGERAHHPRAHAEEVHLRELPVADPGALHDGKHLLHPRLAGDAPAVLHERLQPPRRSGTSSC